MGKRKKKHRSIAGRLIRLILLAYLAAVLVPCMAVPAAKEADQVTPMVQSDLSVDAAVLVTDGDDSFQHRLALIQGARESLRIGTYLFEVDETGTQVMAALMQAADRGVQIQLVTDGIIGMMNFQFAPEVYALAAHENVEIRFYNPVNLLDPAGLMARFHEKYLVADDEWLLLGGRNFSDEFLLSGTTGYSLDLEVLVRKEATGVSAVDLAAQRFDSMWNSGWCGTAYAQVPFYKKDQVQDATDRLRASTVPDGWLPEESAFAPIERSELIGSTFDPHDRSPAVMARLTGVLLESQQDAILCSPYFVIDDDMQQQLRQVAALPGNLTLLTNSPVTGNNIIASADGIYHKDMVSGLDAAYWEVQTVYSLHTKALVVDDSISVVGSFNMDMRSAYLDTEVMLRLDSPAFTAQLRSYMEDLIATSVPCNQQAEATGLRVEAQDYEGSKGTVIRLLAPIISLFRSLV